MFNLVKTVTGLFSGQKSHVLPLEEAMRIMKQKDEDEVPPETEPEGIDKDQECFKRTAKVTFIDNHCITLEGNLYFDNCTIQGLEIGDKVTYLGYIKNGCIKVCKILDKVDLEWSEPQEEKSAWMRRRLVGKVVERKERTVVIHPGNYACDLNKVHSEFVPVVGDWLEVESVVQVDENVSDLCGELLDIVKIAPLRPKLINGTIQKWSASLLMGIINNDVFFGKDACIPGYIPAIGDKICAEVIESDQARCNWRALKIVPEEEVTTTTQRKNNDDPRTVDLVQDKEGVSVTNNIVLPFKKIGEKCIFIVDINNSSDKTYKIIDGYFRNENQQQSQIKLHSPKVLKGVSVKSGEVLCVKFNCMAKYMGVTREMFVFQFEGFQIGRWFTIEVIPEYESQNLENFAPPRNKKEVFRSAKAAILDTSTSDILLGQKPVRPPSFITNKLPMYDIPSRLKEALFTEMQRYAYIGEIPIEKVAPCLAEKLNIQTYADRFHNLVYLEELSLQINMHKYDMPRANFIKNGEYLMLEVADLNERRPSVILGDKVMAYNPNNPSVKLEGFVHKTGARHVYLRFHPNFHDTYNNEDYTIEFQSSRTNFRRYHQAIDLAIRNLGKEFLFPSHVRLKPPQIVFEIDEDDSVNKTASYLSMVHSVRKNKKKEDSPEKNEPQEDKKEESPDKEQEATDKKEESPEEESTEKVQSEEVRLKPGVCPVKLKWFDKKLNLYQRRAVENILRGEARPLPYFIFGPPGTGKTVTLIETILQIARLIPHSRLLVVAPSNSAADLIALRLLDSGVLQPGDLVRMIAFRCVAEGSIPERLVPYCVTGDISREGSRESKSADNHGVRVGMQASVLGRHKITIGTCMVIGNIYTMGFPRGHFTHILIDEAGQATEPEVLIPLCLLDIASAQTVLAGDPLQLGPCVFSRLSEAHGLSESFFERLIHRFPYVRDSIGFPETGGYDPRLVTRLVFNYRSLPEILALPNKLFYDSELQPTISPYDSEEVQLLNTLSEMLPPREGKHPPAIIFHGVRGKNLQTPDSPSWFNLSEAAQVFYYVVDLYSYGLSARDIGIITPYIKQGQQVRALFNEADLDMPKIGSVEEFQGQEFKVIVLTTVRSNEAGARSDTKYGLGFMASPRRLNVAITRSEALLIIVGNPHLLCVDNYWRSVLQYAIEIGGYRGCDLPNLSGS